MADAVITIPVDERAASWYQQAPAAEREHISQVVDEWLEHLARVEGRSLEEVMDDISSKAQQRGLTPEILNDILGDS